MSPRRLRLLVTCALPCAVLFLGTLVVAVASTVWRPRPALLEHAGRLYECGLGPGFVWVVAMHPWPTGTLQPGVRVNFYASGYQPVWRFPGTRADRSPGIALAADDSFQTTGQLLYIGLAWPIPACLFAVPTALLIVPFWRLRRLRLRRAAGLCPACAYDLRGNVSGVCPECGTAVSTPGP
jgi:hypothetical protein